MPTNKAVNPNIVDPKTRKNSNKKKLSPMFTLDNHLIPLPTPESADNVDAPMMIISAKINPRVEAVC